MANYATHIAAGTVGSGVLATLTLAADIVGPESLIAVTLAGVVGSILPDIDLRDSRASSVLFSGIAAFASFCVLFLAAPHYSIAELWILWLGSLLFVRYGLHAIFYRISTHRGVWHSVLAALFCGAVTVVVFHHVMGLHPGVAWLGGGFMVIGYLIHLCLDELYSVDFLGNRLKQSFGTALKLFDSRNMGQSLGMAAATVLVMLATPSPQPFVDAVSSPNLWSGLQQRLLPQDKWFGVIDEETWRQIGWRDDQAGDVAGPVASEPMAATGSDIVTGSIPEAGKEPDAPAAAPDRP